jgi:hypothetical protein
MSGNGLGVHQLLSLLLILSLAPMQACSMAKSSPPVSSESFRQYDLSGVWTGTSITGCLPLRMDGPWRCGARADLMLTLIEEDSTNITGIFASDRGRGDEGFQETGRLNLSSLPLLDADAQMLNAFPARRRDGDARADAPRSDGNHGTPCSY